MAKHSICTVSGCPIPTNTFFCDGHRTMLIDWAMTERKIRTEISRLQNKADEISDRRVAMGGLISQPLRRKRAVERLHELA